MPEKPSSRATLYEICPDISIGYEWSPPLHSQPIEIPQIKWMSHVMMPTNLRISNRNSSPFVSFLASSPTSVKNTISLVVFTPVIQMLFEEPYGHKLYEMATHRGSTISPGFLSPFLEWLLEHTEVHESERSIISAAEKLIIFLVIVIQGFAFRVVEEVFQHSTATVSAVFHEVLKCMLLLHQAIVIPLQDGDETPQEIEDDLKRWPYFADCIGAIDGCHIPICIPPHEHGRWKNRKTQITQNVFALCDFDMNFRYILGEWEGSVHDGRVAASAKTRGLATPLGKYFVTDTAYKLDKIIMTPYPRMRYHPQEFALARKKPKTKEELFNLRHASLRNVIKRCFAVLKRRFRILDRGRDGYSKKTQIEIVYAVTALHNFLNRHVDPETVLNEEDSDSDEDSDDESNESDEEDGEHGLGVGTVLDREGAKSRHNAVAQLMWTDYRTYLNIFE
jgi:hypothetical protein